ncbi:MAG: hypothetical protein MST10_00375 [Lentisphaeria bacterium]|nr:hypothetical protein [Lentisphaeria bacterium]
MTCRWRKLKLLRDLVNRCGVTEIEVTAGGQLERHLEVRLMTDLKKCVG